MVIIVGTIITLTFVFFWFTQKAVGIWKEHRLCSQADLDLNSALSLTILS